jgi:WD40 repeat protein
VEPACSTFFIQDRLSTEHTKSLRCVRFNHNGKSIAVASFDSTITIFILAEDGYEELTTL